MRRALFALVLLTPTARAGLHYSGESFAELPSRWRGFLLDQRALRQVAARPTEAAPASLLRLQYDREAARLARLGDRRTPDDTADLGALLVRLGEPAKAVEVLRPAARANPAHFRLAANLGTAWQMSGDLARAADALEQAVRLAPGRLVRAEQLHLKLVRLRQREKPGTQSLDRLFDGKPPSGAAGWAQQLALWLPADGRLLWQLAELALAHGDAGTAAAMLDGCVTEFGLRDPDLLARRKQARAAVEKATKKEHDDHAERFQPRSSRPLLSKAGLAALPAIDPTGVNALAWEVLAETTVDRQARPTFARYLRELDGKQVELRGHMQPLGDNTDLGAFMLIEHPIGCWFCEMPEVVGIVLVELPEGKSGRYTRDRVRVTGKLVLNATDPENFFYTVRDAKVREDSGE
jgi:tetratricopeptide (TPR) repeat protein